MTSRRNAVNPPSPPIPAESPPPAWIGLFLEKREATLPIVDGIYRPSLDFLPPCDPTALAAFEAEHSVRLPTEYRDFLLFVGNGGGGPDGGIHRLGDSMPGSLPQVTTTITSKDGTITASASTGPRPEMGVQPRLSRPFPLDRPWSVEDPLPIAHDAHVYDGCVPLTDEGCGYFTFLAVSGPAAGMVWLDDSAAVQGGGIRPAGVRFARWMEDWMDGLLGASLVRAAKKALAMGKRSPLHTSIVKWESVVVARDPWSTWTRAVIDLYLERRPAVAAAIAALEENPKSGVDPSQLRRWMFRDEFAAAEGSDPVAMASVVDHPSAHVRAAIAQNRNAPSDLLARLVGDPDHGVRCALAVHPAMPGSLLLSAFEGTRRGWEAPGAAQGSLLLELEAIARRPEATPEVADALTGLGGPFGPWIVRAAALSPGISQGTLEGLAAHPSPVVRQAVALQARTRPQTVEKLAEDAHGAVRLAVAARPELPQALLAILAHDPDAEVRRMVAEHPQATPELLTGLSHDADYGVLCALLRARALPPKVKQQVKKHPRQPMALDGSLFGCWKYTGSRNRSLGLDATSAEVMDDGIYSHPAFPEPLLSPHFDEQYRMGGYAAAKHPFLSIETIAALAADSYGYTRSAIATREDLPPDVVVMLASDPSGMVRAAIAANPLLPLDLHARLAADPDAEVRAGAAQHPGASREILGNLASDEDRYVRRGVLFNPSTPADLRKRLAKDPDPEVRKWASSRR